MKSTEPKRLLSRIKPDGEQRFQKLEKSAMFEKITSEEIKMKQIEAFRFANSAFPFFIKMAHHSIDPLLKPENEEYKNGEYWGDVTHFLLCNKAHGIPLWRELQNQLRSSDTTFSCRPHISTRMTNTILNHWLHSNKAVDKSFYLSEYVLVQLPYQPILLLQWLYASLFTVLVFENQLTDFYQFPVPEEFKNILLNLHKLLKEAQVGLGYLFDYLQHQIDCETEIFVGNLKVFEMAMNKVIPCVRVGVNDNLFQALRDLKKKCWDNKEQEKCDKFLERTQPWPRNFWTL
ncbi:Hypothetical predicted protein [Cloeon dipterum]|uniref:Uncharacterized protein n=1 Tax=Cloeon dipterum TaxID=197152 RepID=A0A8S1DMX6_9INSE|nr:Hypothetical predicted protein [Cloeon dipterum]